MEVACERDAELIARLSKLPEAMVLAYFWSLVRQDVDRSTLLMQLTHVVIGRPPDWNKKAIRMAHEQRRHSSRLKVDSHQCFACRDVSHRHYFHHIVEVQNGGSNDVRNLVPLCFRCHQVLHPWLTVEPEPVVVSDFESLRSIMGRVDFGR